MRCPSHDWDRHCREMDPAEECPMCGAPNYDEKNDRDVYPPDPTFCSQRCKDKYTEIENEAAEEEYRRWKYGH